MDIKKPTFKELKDETLNAVGTNPGNIRLNPIRWIVMNPGKITKQICGLALGLFLTIKIHWIFILIFLGFLLWIIFHWWNAFTRFKVGDVNPGKVVQLNPDKIAVATNMTKGFGDFPILKILNIKLRKEDKVLNKIIPTIAGYSNNPYGYPFWSEFHPVPMNHGLSKKSLIEYYSNTYGDVEIDTLNQYIGKVNSLEPETYKIDEETSGWVNFKKVEIGDLNKMKGPEDAENKAEA